MSNAALESLEPIGIHWNPWVSMKKSMIEIDRNCCPDLPIHQCRSSSLGSVATTRGDGVPPNKAKPLSSIARDGAGAGGENLENLQGT